MVLEPRLLSPLPTMNELLAAIAARADATHIILSVIVLVLLAMMREQARGAAERDKMLSEAMDRLAEVITQLRVDMPRVRK